MATRRFYPYLSRVRADQEGVNRAWTLTTLSHAREGTTEDDDQPRLVANELIASSIGQFLKLPVPPFALMRNAKEKCIFASLHVHKTLRPPDTIAERCVDLDAFLCTGILVFDSFVMNVDRHAGNVIVDDPDDPSQIDLIDHDMAVFGCIPGEELKHMATMSERTALLPADCTGAKRHCFLDWIPIDHLGEWLDRVATIPDWFIRETCQETIGLGVTKELADGACEVLIGRRNRLGDILEAAASEFTSIPDNAVWGFHK